MQRITLLPPLTSSDLDTNPTFNVVIAYEDFATGKHAKKTYDYLAANLGHDCQFCNQMWKFEVLGISKLREMAAKDAAIADIIMISSHGNIELSAEVKAWIESWDSQKTNAIALVALFDAPGENPTQTEATCNYLAGVAKRANLEFFAQQQGSGVASGHDLFGLNRALNVEAPAIATLTAISPDLSSPRWGINE